MKNYLVLALMLLIVTSCEKDEIILEDLVLDKETEMVLEKSAFDDANQYNSPSETLFDSPKYESLIANYPSLNQDELVQSFETHTQNGQTVYSMNINESTRLFFNVEGNETANVFVVDIKESMKSGDVDYFIYDENMSYLTEYSMIETGEGQYDVYMPVKSCWGDCMDGIWDACVDQGIIVAAGCVIASPIFAIMCGLECMF